jgi:prefoldin alpha subunit
MSEQKNNQANIQQMFMQMQQIEEQSRHMEQEAQAVEQKKNEFSILIEQLNNYGKTKKDAKTFATIGAGVFAEAKLANSDEFLVNVGAGTFVKKSVAEVKKTMQAQLDELQKIQMQINQNLQMLAIQGQIMQAQMQKE